MSLRAPVLFVHAATRHVVASQADAYGTLKPLGSVFVGRLEEPVNHDLAYW